MNTSILKLEATVIRPKEKPQCSALGLSEM